MCGNTTETAESCSDAGIGESLYLIAGVFLCIFLAGKSTAPFLGGGRRACREARRKSERVDLKRCMGPVTLLQKSGLSALEGRRTAIFGIGHRQGPLIVKIAPPNFLSSLKGLRLAHGACGTATHGIYLYLPPLGSERPRPTGVADRGAATGIADRRILAHQRTTPQPEIRGSTSVV